MKNSLLNLLINTSNDFVYEINLKKNSIKWYKDIYKQLNFNKDTKLESIDNIIKLINNNDAELFKKKLSNRSNNTIEISYKIKDSYNNYQTWSDSYTYIEKEHTIIGVCKNISKDQNISYSKELFQATKVPAFIISADNMNILDANKEASIFYGYSKEEFILLNFTNISNLPKEKTNEEIKLALNKDKYCFPSKHKLKNKTIKNVEVYSSPIIYNNKKALYSLVFDISKRKNFEAKVKQAHTIYQNTKEGIFITNLEGEILSVNRAFEKITLYKEEEVLNKNVSILKSNIHNRNFYKTLWSSIITQGYWEGEIINKTKKGEKFPQWLTINTVYDDNFKPVNYVGVFSDFSKLKAQEKLLREKDHIMFQQSKMAAMGEMLRNIAHQWRQPLSVISSSASGLKLKKEFNILEEKDFEEFSEATIKSVNYLSETIEDFSNYFKNEQNKENHLISEIINKSMQLSSASLKNLNIKFEIELKEDLEINVIKNELIQVLLNLINNSKDAFQSKKQEVQVLKIKALKVDKFIYLYISDNAGGIRKNILEKIFEPYFTTKHQSQGTGIGLYMSQQIIQEHLNGSVSAYNIKQIIDNIEYLGAEFKIILPLT